MLCIGKNYVNAKALYVFWFSSLSPPSLPQTHGVERVVAEKQSDRVKAEVLS